MYFSPSLIGTELASPCILSLQAMRFGSLPAWATELSNSIREAVLLGGFVPEFELSNADESEDSSLFPILPLELLGREPFFDQLIVNLYQPGEVRYCLVLNTIHLIIVLKRFYLERVLKQQCFCFV